MKLYVRVNASQLHLDSSLGNFIRRVRPEYAMLVRERLQASRAHLVCNFNRLASAFERVHQTTEPGGLIYRKTLGCKPFTVAQGDQATAIVFISPSSPSVVHESRPFAPVHTFFRLYVSTSSTLSVVDGDFYPGFFRWLDNMEMREPWLL